MFDRVSLPYLNDLTLAEIEQQVLAWGWPKFRAAQIADWVHGKGVNSYATMTNLSTAMQTKLADNFNLGGLIILEEKVATDQSTKKYLFGLSDGQAVESVLMRYNYGLTACLSTQVGCRMGCSICASGLDGLVRNLRPGEMLDQIWAMQHDTGQRIRGIVLMGSGEPLDNYEATIKFLELVHADYGLNIGHRQITLSTCGLVPRIYDLAGLNLAITLAISLHAPDNRLRNQLMPINKAYPLEKLLPACEFYARYTGRRVSFEYAMLEGTNDHPRQAKQLAAILKGIHCHINLIPTNFVPEHNLKRSSARKIQLFQAVLEQAGYPVTVRREMGTDIDAACGQLRRRILAKQGGVKS